ncbi:non-ribosomal peptide synthetase [Paraburkholderia bryophila]|uniref:Amino acid adenylation domain-containing protein n=1 Tax=Paraburkholderia bryophila TaxID=420952 RepID=A0A329CLU4_9BURK|nr:non-ribosomal peptide synthetase [Paraburkholderia bryophila]RAS35360.1 amino acid adenylation domain-containing protein [Paraburkholderia bryophila]
MQADKSVAGGQAGNGIETDFVAGDWKSRVIEGRKTGASVTLPAWLDASYETLRTHVMDPAYPCFFGTIAERRGEMFYSFVNGKDIADLPATMQTFAELASRPEYRKNNIAVFFEPDAEPLSHDTYHELFWNALQTLHNVDPDPEADNQPPPSHEDWEFSFAGVQMFVVCACPSFNTRHSRNLGPGMVLLFQPRSVFVDTITNKVIGREARIQVRKRLETWDDVTAHPDLGFYGDPGNLEWKQYFLTDENIPASDQCPFLKRNKREIAAGLQTLNAAPVAVSAHGEFKADADADADAQDLIGRMLHHVATQPDRIAVRFLADGERDEQVLTYGQLHRRALACAEHLSRTAQRGERAILLLPSGLDYVVGFLGCLYAGVIAVPAYPPESSNPQHLQRVKAMLDDCTPRVMLTDSAHAELLANLAANAEAHARAEAEPAAKPRTTLLLDALPPAVASAFELQRPAAADIAFLQYTSGSTAAPKGVMVSHGNVRANEIAIRDAMAFSADDVMVSWLPLYHDMGLIGGLLAPLFVGFPVVLMTPAHFLERPARWLQAISNYRATVSGGPNFAFQLCAERVRAEQLTEVDLSTWRVAFCGAEPIRAAALEGFARVCAEANFSQRALYPCYGLAEATLLVSGVDAGQGYALFEAERHALAAGRAQRVAAADSLEKAQATRLVEGGRVQAHHTVRIVDPRSGADVASGAIGEIWFSGPSVAQGYWNNPQASAETFVSDDAGRWLRTGDLGFMADGRLYVNGRVKDLIIVRGQNFYPQDIEATLNARVDALRPGRVAAFAVTQGRDGEAGEGIGIAAEISRATARDLDEAALFAQIEAAILDAHREPVAAIAILKPGSLPRTSSGKLRRADCARGWREQTLDVFTRYSRDETGVSTRNGTRREAATPTEAALLAIWQSVFESTGLSCDADFFALGGQSITATALVARIRAAFGRDVPLEFVFEHRSIAAQAAWLDAGQPDAGHEERAVPFNGANLQADATALSPGQRALWYLWREAPESSAYNVSGAFRLDGTLDVAKLADAVRALVRRHAQLNLRVRQDGVNLQAAFDADAAQLDVIDTRTCNQGADELVAALVDAPFDLERGPLFRAHLVHGEEGSPTLVLSLHHIIADAQSCAVLLRDLMSLYASADSLAVLPATYADYSAAQNAFTGSDAEHAQLDFWRATVGDASPVARLPADRPQRAQAPRGHQRGGRLRIDLPAQLGDALRHVANDESTTLFTVLLSAFAVALERHANQSSIRIGVPVSNRRDLALENVVGYFVNTTVVCAQVERGQTFGALVDTLQQRLLAARRHADVPFSRVSDALRHRGPLFEVMFNLEEAVLRATDAPAGLSLSDLGVRPRDVPFELSLDVTARRDGVSLSFSYLASRFDAATIDAFARRYVGLLEQIATNPSMKIGQWQVDEVAALAAPAAAVVTHANEGADFVALTARIERHVRETPHAIALRCDGEALSYVELSARAAQLANALHAAGVQADESVAILLGRTPTLVAAMLGTLRSGACYVPLDAAYPHERIAHMLKDARACVVITDEAHAREHAEALAGRRLILTGQVAGAAPLAYGEAAAESRTESHANSHLEAPARVQPDQLAYIVFTSGSTGRPKGVAISQRALTAHIDDFIAMHELGRDDVLLQFSTLSFDASIEQLWPALAVGATVTMRGDTSWDPDRLEAHLRAERVTLADLPTSYWREWVGTLAGRERTGAATALRTITIGGEAVSADLLGRWQNGPFGHVRFVNTYGPTETTVVALAHRTLAEDAACGVVPIGKPLARRRVVLLDRYGDAVPVGGVGELCIGGPTLARGYIGQPGISAAAFVPDSSGEPGARLYRTGDLCRQRADGSVDYLGRLDQQLKIRGVRVEPGEVETALRQIPGIGDALVMAHLGAAQTEPQLVAYVVASGAQPLDAASLRRTLAEMLPPVMIPTAFVTLDAFPLTANGKLDRRALPAPSHDTSGDTSANVDLSPLEAQLLALYREVLQQPSCSADDDFFALGGDSILSLQLVARAKQAGLTLTSRQIFAAPHVRGLAQLLASEPAGANASAAPTQTARWAANPLPRHDGEAAANGAAGLAQRSPSAGLSEAQIAEHFVQADAIESLHPLSPMQRGMLSHALHAQADPYYVQHTFTLDGIRDPQRFEQAWQAVVARHPILRTDFHWDGLPVPVQAVRKQGALALDLRDWRGVEAQALRERLIAEWRAAHAQGFDFANAAALKLAMIRVDAERYVLAWCFHHIQLDGWSLAALFNEVALTYSQLVAPAAASGGAVADTTPAPEAQAAAAPGFGHYADWLAAQSFEVSAQWWRDALAGFDERTPVPFASSARSRGEASNGASAEARRYAEQHVDLEVGLSEALRNFTRTHGITLNTLMQGAWAWLLARHSGKRDVVFGMTTAGRSAPLEGIERSVGLFINTVPLRVAVPAEQGVAAWLHDLQRHGGSVREHELMPLDAIQAGSELGADQALFDTIVVFDNFPIDPHMTQYPHGIHTASHAELPLTDDVQGADTFGRNHFALSLVVSPAPQPRVVLAYDRLAIGDAEVAALQRQLLAALAQLTSSADAPLGALGWQQTPDAPLLPTPRAATQSADPTSLLQIVAARAAHERTGAADALVFNGERMSWSALWAWSGQIARRLAAAQDAQGASAGRPQTEPHIALLLPRGPALVAGILAAWRVGAAYVPLDPGHPAQRLAWQIEDCGATLCLCEARPSWLPEAIAAVPPARHFADGAGFVDRAVAAHAVHPAQTAYVIYTSGSTGQPKGVAVSHGALRNYTRSLVARVPAAIRSAAYVSTPAADLGHTVLFGALWAGWTLHPLDEDCAFDPDRFAAYIGQYEIDLLKIVPGHLASLLQARQAARVLPRQCLIVGGEATPAALAARIRALAPRCLLLNHYGPTETTVGALTGVAPDDLAQAASLTLDEPIDAMCVAIVDQNGHAVPRGVAGELCIGGAGLARGYLHQPGRSAERFVPDPHGATGERLYRTGDRARRLASGRIEWLGRIDEQVKIRGFRVEPDEIAAVLRGLAGVRDAAVLARRVEGDGNDGRLRLTAYVCGEALDDAALRQSLVALLPDALVPAQIIVLAQLPLTKNGKLDRAALDALTEPAQARRSVEPPANPVESRLLAIWCEVLGRADIGVLDNFFEAGGDSILSLKLIAKARRAGLSLSPKLVLGRPTVRALAAQIAVQTDSSSDASSNPQTTGGTSSPGAAAVGNQTLKSWLEELE